MINFAAHGPLAHPGVMSAIVGHNVTGVPATLGGHRMGIQTLGDIGVPVVVDILTKAWHKNFKAYVLVPSTDGNEPPISVVVYQLTKKDYDKVYGFELVDEGWMDFVVVTVRLADGTNINATIERLRPTQRVSTMLDVVPDPLEPLLPVDWFIQHAEQVSMAPTMINVLVIVHSEDATSPSLGMWKQYPRRLHVSESTPLLEGVLGKVTRYEGGETDKIGVAYVRVDAQKYAKLAENGWKSP